jgi:hypothetical protein
MEFLPLLGKRLKDDEIIEVLESACMDVIYDFDRSHENIADCYWTTAKKDGYRFKFDADQILAVIFLHVAPIDGFTPIRRDDCDISFFSGIGEAETYAAQHQLRAEKGGPTDFLGVRRYWLRLEFATYSVHYEFRSEGLALVTLSLRKN